MKSKFCYLHVIVYAIPVAVLCIVFRQSIFGSGMYFDGDTILNFFPYYNFFAHEGGARIMHDILSGFPAHVSVTGIWFYPLNQLLLLIFDTFDAYRYLLIFNLVMTHVFTYAFARRLGFDCVLSSFISLVFLFSGQLMRWSTTNVNTNYFFILPAVLYFTELVRTHRMPYVFLVFTGIFLGAGWLSGHIQFVMYIHIFSAVYYAYWVLQIKAPRQIIIRVSQIIGVFIISFLIGYPQIAAILGFSGNSARADGVSVSDFFSGSYLPQDLIHFILPFWSNPAIPTGTPNLYIGILPFLLLVLSIFVYKRIHHAHFKFFFWTFVICFVSAIYYSPLGLLLHIVPLMDSFRAIPRIMYIGGLGVAVSIGFALQYIVNNHEQVKKILRIYLMALRRIFLFAVLPIVSAATALQLFFYDRIQKLLQDYFFKNIYATTSGLPTAHYLAVIDQYLTSSLQQISFNDWQVVVMLVCSLSSYMLLRRVTRLGKNTVVIFALVITALNMTAVYAGHFKAVEKKELLDPSPTAAYIMRASQDGERFRVYSVFPGMTEFNELVVKCGKDDEHELLALQKSLLTPNVNAYFGIDSIDGYDNFMPQAYAELLAYVGSERATAGELLAYVDEPLEKRIATLLTRSNVLKMMNVRYVVSRFELPHDDFKKVFETQVGACQTSVAVYELAGTWPRYLMSNRIVMATDGTLGSFTDALQQNPEQGTLIMSPTSAKVNRGLLVTTKNVYPVGAQTVKDVVIFNITVETDMYLFIGNAHLPGWRATLDGEVTEILKANYAYMAVAVPAGTHRIELTYE